MPELVIDGLESVQVEQQQNHLPVLARPPSQCLVEPIPQQPAIGQPRQLVVVGEVACLHFLLRKLRHDLLEA
jgi:hypothetical protein